MTYTLLMTVTKMTSTLLTITVRQAAVAAQRTMTFQYGMPLERHSYRQVLKSF